MRKHIVLALAASLLTLLPLSHSATTQPAPIPERTVGPTNAAVTIEVFTDFQCPGCRELALQTLPHVIDDYCNKGTVRLIHREFPLNRPDHKYSREAARWAVTCALFGKYDAVAELLFLRQQVWGTTGNIEGTLSTLLTPAEMQKVKQAMNARKADVEAAINHDQSLIMATGAGITTPTIIVRKNGVVISRTEGFVSYPLLKRHLDEVLARR